jgi:SAM-dependent methyltransferase
MKIGLSRVGWRDMDSSTTIRGTLHTGGRVMSVRDFTVEQAAALAPGDHHYRAFVGPTYRYDLIGAQQFGLLYLLGLRETHRLLDFGCGSLRLGRLAIPYLLKGRYFGIEPEAWLVDDGFDRELGRDALALKEPRFDHNADYRADVFGTAFDYIIAQSIFSHTGEAASRRALTAFKGSLAPGGLIVVNWMVGPEAEPFHPDTSEWVYPGCVTFSPERIERIAAEAGLAVRPCPWWHPGLNWYVLAHSEAELPDSGFLAPLALQPLSR